MVKTTTCCGRGGWGCNPLGEGLCLGGRVWFLVWSLCQLCCWRGGRIIQGFHFEGRCNSFAWLWGVHSVGLVGVSQCWEGGLVLCRGWEAILLRSCFSSCSHLSHFVVVSNADQEVPSLAFIFLFVFNSRHFWWCGHKGPFPGAYCILGYISMDPVRGFSRQP